MQHVLYALFDTELKARAAMQEVNATAPPDPRCQMFVHRSAVDRFRSGDMPMQETRAWRGLTWGAMSGTIAGAALGGLLSATGFHPPGVLATIVFTSCGGAVLGALAGGLSGAGAPDPRLEKLEKELRNGRVVVTVSAPSVLSKEHAHDIFAKHGAVVDAN